MGCGTICINVCCIVFLVSLIVTLITLDYVGVEPKFYIQQLYIPSLNNSHTYNASNLNSSIIIDLKFKRTVAYVPLRYKDINITLYYGRNRSLSVGSFVIPGFKQGMKKTVRRSAVVEARGLPWEDAFRKISGGSTVALAVELATKYQLKRYGKYHSYYTRHNQYGGYHSYNTRHNRYGGYYSYYTRRKAAVVEADVEVDGSGAEVSNKPIRFH